MVDQVALEPAFGAAAEAEAAEAEAPGLVTAVEAAPTGGAHARRHLGGAHHSAASALLELVDGCLTRVGVGSFVAAPGTPRGLRVVRVVDDGRGMTLSAVARFAKLGEGAADDAAPPAEPEPALAAAPGDEEDIAAFLDPPFDGVEHLTRASDAAGASFASPWCPAEPGWETRALPPGTPVDE